MNNAWYYDNFDNASDNPLVTDLLEKGYCIVRNSVSSTTIDSFLRRYEAFKQDVLSQHARSLTEGEDVVLGRQTADEELVAAHDAAFTDLRCDAGHVA